MQTNIEALRAAMNDLTGKNDFCLGIYFSKNQNGYTFDLSPADATSWGIPRSSFYKSFNTLVEKGYLVQRGESNHYDFYENPREPVFTITTNKAE